MLLTQGDVCILGAKLLQKQRVVLLKTTACFTENDVSFYSKQRVVLRRIIPTFLNQKSVAFN